MLTPKCPSHMELVALFEIAKCLCPVSLQRPLCVVLDVGVRVAQLSDEYVKADYQHHEEEEHHETNGQPSTERKKKSTVSQQAD